MITPTWSSLIPDTEGGPDEMYYGSRFGEGYGDGYAGDWHGDGYGFIEGIGWPLFYDTSPS